MVWASIVHVYKDNELLCQMNLPKHRRDFLQRVLHANLCLRIEIELRGVLNFKQNFLTDLQVVLVLVFLNRINIKRIGLLKDKYRINGYGWGGSKEVPYIGLLRSS